ncbi:MAG: hypothetical protein ACPGVB_10450, partial [Chitinophagales bacterium]
TAGFNNTEGTQQDVWTLKVRGNTVQYYVNDVFAYEGAKGLDWKFIGVFVEDVQTIEFDELTVWDVQ